MTIIAKGHCACGTIRYEVKRPPLFVHCCHCRRCQRETGSAFAHNALIEADNVTLLAGAPEIIDTPSDSGKGQLISRCPDCKVAVWSIYLGAGPRFFFCASGHLKIPTHLRRIFTYTPRANSPGCAFRTASAQCRVTIADRNIGRRNPCKDAKGRCLSWTDRPFA